MIKSSKIPSLVLKDFHLSYSPMLRGRGPLRTLLIVVGEVGRVLDYSVGIERLGIVTRRLILLRIVSLCILLLASTIKYILSQSL